MVPGRVHAFRNKAQECASSTKASGECDGCGGGGGGAEDEEAEDDAEDECKTSRSWRSCCRARIQEFVCAYTALGS